MLVDLAETPWLDIIPENWNVIKLKWTVGQCRNGIWGAEPDGDDSIICLRVADFDRNKFCLKDDGYTLRKIEPKDQVGRLLKNGDLLLEKSGGGENQLVGAVVQFRGNMDAVSSNFIAKMSPNVNYHSRFLTYLHAYLYSIKVNYRSIKQTTGIQNLDSAQYLNEFVALPDFTTQKSIASFLDHKTAQIDNLIAEKERLLNLLEEKRIALITQAVTKGLDPNAKMEPSGIDWLGDIPAHWEVKRFKYYVTINPKKSEVSAKDINISFVPMEAIGEYGGINLESEKILDDVFNGYTYFRNDDIVVAKITPCFENGKGARATNLTNSIAFGTTELHVLRSSPSILPEYLEYLTYSYPFRKWGEAEMYGSGGQKRVPEDFLKNFLIGIPPIAEQKQIIGRINELLNDIHLLKVEISSGIKKLKEYRISLITSAVTGKIDVRDYKPVEEHEKTH